MIRIICSVYEKCDFIEFLLYAKQKKIEECEKGKMTQTLLRMELKRIEKLLQRIDGKYVEDYDMSSLKYSKRHPSGHTQKDDLPKPDGVGWKWG